MSRRYPFLFYISRRVLTLCVLVVFISFVVFTLLYFAPGSPALNASGQEGSSPETVRLLNERFHLNEPFLTQYWIWASHAARLDFGLSYRTQLPVDGEISKRLPVTLFLGIYAFILTTFFGIVFGIVAALRRRTAVDRTIVATSVVGLATPTFVIGTFLLYLFAVAQPWFPITGAGTGFTDRLWHLSLPAIALALHLAAYVVKHTRSSVIGVLDQDYVTFARARGLSRTRVLLFYELRNALMPIVTIAGIVLAGVIVGAAVIETLFSVPGIGDMLVSDALYKDLPGLEAVAILVAVLIMVVNLFTDLLYAAVDPRVRLRGSR